MTGVVRHGFGGVMVKLWLVLFIFLAMLRHAHSEEACANCISHCNEDTGVCSGDCKTNYYGKKCQEHCIECKEGCEKDTGKCLNCWYGSYGDYCNGTCGTECFGCDRTTGICSSCRSGYYGKFCSARCPTTCHASCNKEGFCNHCSNNYWGPECESNCSANCKYGCDITTGKCKDCKPSYRGEFCEIRCNDKNCKGCYITGGEEVCYACLDGFFGNHCDKNCSPNCKYNSCSQLSGECGICKNGWFGDTCEQSCIENCARCFDNITCMECMEGFYGDQCQHKCRAGCKKCSRDGNDCLACSNEGSLPWYSHNCSCTVHECWPHRYSCESCKDKSWFNAFHECCPCEIRHCATLIDDYNTCGTLEDAECNGTCQAGYYGRFCSLQCNPNCGGIGHRCDKVTGHCMEPCNEGWYGPKCNVHCKTFYPHCTQCKTEITGAFADVKCVDCEKGYYVKSSVLKRCDKCEHCVNDACNVTTGECLEGCDKGFYTGYSRLCLNSCENCIDGHCYDNGTCVVPGCKSGYFQRGCLAKCPQNCLTNECDAATGECFFGCKQGYFGKLCFSKCKNCRDDLCNHTTGKCFECKPAFWGDNCEHSCTGCIDEVCTHPEGCRYGCKPGQYSKFCNLKCLDQCSACDQTSGICSICNDDKSTACLEEHRLPWSLSVSEFPSNGSCTKGTYGPYCNIPCPSGCSANENKSPICDRYTGTCLFSGCMQNLYGMYCEKHCPMCNVEDIHAWSCDRINGHCFSCGNGSYGTFCENKCKDTCIDSVCSQQSGHCVRGCKYGWTGVQCEVNTDIADEISLSHTVLAVVIPIVVMLVIAVTAIICCKLRSKRSQYTATTTEEDL